MNTQDELLKQYEIDVLADEAGGYFSPPTEEGLAYTDLFFSVCKQFGIRYSQATPKERYFAEEVTRVTWAIQHGEKVGDTVRPAFTA
jgi:hypothetical protein